ncbi:MAG TPA: hypothetical protein VHY48_12075 [Acidobacteriaceae bacterium]|nr:hypothetical protein [Acidobacteriaceae bacterium]
MRTLTASRIGLVLLATLTLAATPSALKAQGTPTAVTANIPFAFQIGSSHYAAGKYTVKMLSAHLLTVQGDSGSGMMVVISDSTNHPSATSKLVFHHYGNQYFLSELRIGGDPEFVKSPASKAERRARLEQEASNRNPGGNKSSNTEVAVLVSPR